MRPPRRQSRIGPECRSPCPHPRKQIASVSSCPFRTTALQADRDMAFIKTLRPLAFALAVCGLGACTPIYQLDIQQGNLFSKTQVEALKPGMTKRQVMLTMGSPSVINPFQQ